MSSVNVLSLPKEVWTLILHNNALSGMDIVQSKRVCRLFWTIIEHDSFQSVWKIRFEIDFDPTRFKYHVGIDWQKKYNAYASQEKTKREAFQDYMKNRGADYSPQRAIPWLKAIVDGRANSEERDAAFGLFKECGEGRLDGELMYYLGFLAMNGIGIPRSLKHGFDYYKKSAKRNFPLGQLALAKCYQTGVGTRPNLGLFITFAERAADQGLAEAHLQLAKIYQWMDVDFISHGKAFQHLKIAADSGLEAAFYPLACAYLNGEGTEVNEEKALHFLTLAANQGIAEAQYTLGTYLSNCSEPTKDLKKGAFYLKLAADQGYAKAAK